MQQKNATKNVTTQAVRFTVGCQDFCQKYCSIIDHY